MDQIYSILVVDDDTDIRRMLSEILEFEGYRVHQAAGGKSALDLAERYPIDAFLLDLEMPVMNGIELCRKIRAIDRFKVTPVIFLTASGAHLNVSEAFDAGCDDFIDKPFN